MRALHEPMSIIEYANPSHFRYCSSSAFSSSSSGQPMDDDSQQPGGTPPPSYTSSPSSSSSSREPSLPLNLRSGRDLTIQPYQFPDEQVSDAWRGQERKQVMELFHQAQMVRDVSGGRDPLAALSAHPRYNKAIKEGHIPVELINRLNQLQKKANLREMSQSSFEQQARNVPQKDSAGFGELASNVTPPTKTRAQRFQELAAAHPHVEAQYEKLAAALNARFGKGEGGQTTAASLKKTFGLLSDEQMAMVTSPDPFRHVDSGAGSGKSTTLAFATLWEMAHGANPRQFQFSSSTNSGVNNLFETIQKKVQPFVPKSVWDVEASREQQFRTWHKADMSYMHGRTVLTDEGAYISPLEAGGYKGYQPMGTTGKGSVARTIEEAAAKGEEAQRAYLQKVLEKQGLSVKDFASQGVYTLSDLTRYINDLKSERFDDARYKKTVERGQELYQQHQRTKLEALAYAYEEARRNRAGFAVEGQTSPLYDLSDPFVLASALRKQGLGVTPRYIVGDEIQDATGGVFRSLRSSVRPGSKVLLGGDVSQKAVQTDTKVNALISRLFAQVEQYGSSSRHTFTGNYRSGPVAVEMMNRLHQERALQGREVSPLQYSMRGPGDLDEMPDLHVARDQPSMYQTMLDDWLERMQLTPDRIAANYRAGKHPLSGSAISPMQAPFIFQTHEQVDAFQKHIQARFAQKMGSETAQKVLDQVYTNAIPEPANAHKLHALTVAKARSRDFDSPFVDVTRVGKWDLPGYIEQMFTALSRVGGQKNRIYSMEGNLAGHAYDNSADYFGLMDGVLVPHGFGSILHDTLQGVVTRQSIPRELLPEFYQDALMHYPGSRSSQGVTPQQSALQMQYVEDFLRLHKEYKSPVGSGSGVHTTQEGEDAVEVYQSDEGGESRSAEGFKVSGRINAQIAAGHTRQGDLFPMEQTYSLVRSLVTQGPRYLGSLPGSTSSSPSSIPSSAFDFFDAMRKGVRGRAKEATWEDPEEQYTSAHMEENDEGKDFAPRENQFYEGADVGLFRENVREMLRSPEALQLAQVQSLLRDQFTHPLVVKGVLKKASDLHLGGLQKQIEAVQNNPASLDELMARINSGKVGDSRLKGSLLWHAANRTAFSPLSEASLTQFRDIADLTGKEEFSQFMGAYGDQMLEEQRSQYLITPEIIKEVASHDPMASAVLQRIAYDKEGAFRSYEGQQAELEKLPYHQGMVLRGIKSAEEGKRLGISLPESRIATYGTEIAAYAARLQKDGIVDPQAVQAVRGAGESDEQVASQVTSLGAGVPLDSYIRRLSDMLERGQYGKGQFAQVKAEYNRAKRLHATLTNPEFQRTGGHALNIAGRVLMGTGPVMMGGEQDNTRNDPIDQLFRNQRNQYKEGQRTLGSAEEYTRVLHEMSSHVASHGTVKREHLERLATTLGHSVDDPMFAGLHHLEGKGVLATPESELSLSALAHEFPDPEHGGQEYKNMLAQLTRTPLHEGQHAVFMGGVTGFTPIVQGQAGMRAGMVGQLLPLGKGDFGLSKDLGTYRKNRLLTGEEYKQYRDEKNASLPLEPLMQFQLKSGKTHLVRASQLAGLNAQLALPEQRAILDAVRTRMAQQQKQQQQGAREKGGTSAERIRYLHAQRLKVVERALKYRARRFSKEQVEALKEQAGRHMQAIAAGAVKQGGGAQQAQKVPQYRGFIGKVGQTSEGGITFRGQGTLSKDEKRFMQSVHFGRAGRDEFDLSGSLRDKEHERISDVKHEAQNREQYLRLPKAIRDLPPEQLAQVRLRRGGFLPSSSSSAQSEAQTSPVGVDDTSSSASTGLARVSSAPLVEHHASDLLGLRMPAHLPPHLIEGATPQMMGATPTLRLAALPKGTLSFPVVSPSPALVPSPSRGSGPISKYAHLSTKATQPLPVIRFPEHPLSEAFLFNPLTRHSPEVLAGHARAQYEQFVLGERDRMAALAETDPSYQQYVEVAQAEYIGLQRQLRKARGEDGNRELAVEGTLSPSSSPQQQQQQQQDILAASMTLLQQGTPVSALLKETQRITQELPLPTLAPEQLISPSSSSSALSSPPLLLLPQEAASAARRRQVNREYQEMLTQRGGVYRQQMREEARTRRVLPSSPEVIALGGAISTPQQVSAPGTLSQQTSQGSSPGPGTGGGMSPPSSPPIIPPVGTGGLGNPGSGGGGQPPSLDQQLQDVAYQLRHGSPGYYQMSPQDRQKAVSPPSKEQLGILDASEQAQIIQAGPGSGKSNLIARMVADLVATHRVLPKNIHSFSDLRSAVARLHESYAPYLQHVLPTPQSDAYKLPRPMTYHSFGTKILLQKEFDQATGRTRYPMLEKLGLGHYTGHILSDMSEEELQDQMADPSARGAGVGQTEFLTNLLQQYSGQQGTKMPSDIKQVLQGISTQKKNRYVDPDVYNTFLAQGQAEITAGKELSKAGQLALYEQERHKAGYLDFDDVPDLAANLIEQEGTAAIPEDYRHTQAIIMDEAQGLSHGIQRMMRGFGSAISHNNPRWLVGMDPMQAIHQGLGNIPIHDIKGKLFEMIGLPQGKTAMKNLSLNFRGDIRGTALNNAFLKMAELKGEPKSPEQVPVSPEIGSEPEFLTEHSQPSLYRKMFLSMLATHGITFHDMKANIAKGEHPLAGMDFGQEDERGPWQSPLILQRNQDVDLAGHVMKETLAQGMGLSMKEAEGVYKQLVRQRPPGMLASPETKEKARRQFWIGTAGNFRSFDFANPHVDASVLGKWRQVSDWKGHLKQLFTSVSRASAGGLPVIGSASHIFTKDQAREYMHPLRTSFEEGEEMDPHRGTMRSFVRLNGNAVKGDKRSNPDNYQGQAVPPFFGKLLSLRDQALHRWGIDPTRADLHHGVVANPAQLPEGMPITLPNAATTMPMAGNMGGGGITNPSLPSIPSLPMVIPLSSAGGGSGSGGIGGGIGGGGTISSTGATGGPSTVNINTAPSSTVNVNTNGARTSGGGGGGGGGTPPGVSQLPTKPLPIVQIGGGGGGSGGTLSVTNQPTQPLPITPTGTPPSSPSPSGGGSGGGGRGGSGGGGGGGGGDIWNTMSNMGRTLARIGYEAQFVGKLLDQVTNEAATQGSEYRRATLSFNQQALMRGGGSQGDLGMGASSYFNALDASSPIRRQAASVLPMYAWTQIAQGYHGLSAAMGYNGLTTTPQSLAGGVNDIYGLAALSGMDPTQLTAQMAQIGGISGIGQGAIGQTAGILGQMYGGTFDQLNVAPTLSALSTMLPFMRGMAPGINGETSIARSMAFLQTALASGQTAQNLPDIANMFNSLTAVGTNPNLQQQYYLGQLYGQKNLTAGTEYAQFQSQFTGEQQQLDTLRLQQYMNLPGLQIKVAQADIQMDQSNIQMATLNLQQAELSQQGAQLGLQSSQLNYQGAQLGYAYNVAGWNLQVSQQNALYGPVGADVSRTAYYQFLRNQQAASYNATSPELATRPTSAPVFGLKNEEFYAQMENQRNSLILQRSPLLSDALFQQQMKYINQQEDFYKRELALTNQKRAFDLTWQPQLLEQQKKQLDMQGKQLTVQAQQVALQGQVLEQQKVQTAIQQEQLANDIAMKQYQVADTQLQAQYLPQQIADLEKLIAAQRQNLLGQGPVNGGVVDPIQLLQKIAQFDVANKLSPQDLQQMLRTMVPIQNQDALYRMIKTIEANPSQMNNLTANFVGANDKGLLAQLQAYFKQGAFSDQVNQSSVLNNFLSFAGNSQNWKNFSNAVNDAATNTQKFSQALSGFAADAKNWSMWFMWGGPALVGAATLLNLFGFLGTNGGKLLGVFQRMTNYFDSLPSGPVTLSQTGETSTVTGAEGGAAAAGGSVLGGVLGVGSIGLLSALLGWNTYNSNESPLQQFLTGLNPGVAFGDSAHNIWNMFSGQPYQGSQANSQDYSAAQWLDNLFHTGFFSSLLPNQGGGGGSGSSLKPNIPPPPETPEYRGPTQGITTDEVPKLLTQNNTSLGTVASHLKGILGFSQETARNTGQANIYHRGTMGFSQETARNTGQALPYHRGTMGFSQETAMNTGQANTYHKGTMGFSQETAINTAQGTSYQKNTMVDTGTALAYHKQMVGYDGQTATNTGQTAHNTAVMSQFQAQVLAGALKNPPGTGGADEPPPPGFSSPHINLGFGAPVWYGTGKHQGVDFAASQGTPIDEFIGGKVVASGFQPWGGEIDVKTIGGLTERYLHLSQLGVSVGQILKQGDRIGLTGGGTPQSGFGYWSRGAHSHVQIDDGNINQGMNPWPIWALGNAFDISRFYVNPGASQATASHSGGGGGEDGGIPHLARGGIALRKTLAQIADGGEPEAVLPLSKLANLLSSTLSARGISTTTPDEPQMVSPSQRAALSISKLADTFEVHVHTTASTLSAEEADTLAEQVMDIILTAANKANGKLLL